MHLIDTVAGPLADSRIRICRTGEQVRFTFFSTWYISQVDQKDVYTFSSTQNTFRLDKREVQINILYISTEPFFFFQQAPPILFGFVINSVYLRFFFTLKYLLLCKEKAFHIRSKGILEKCFKDMKTIAICYKYKDLVHCSYESWERFISN